MASSARFESGKLLLSLYSNLYKRPTGTNAGSTITSPVGKKLVEMMREGSLKNRKQGIQKLRQRMRRLAERLVAFKIGSTWQSIPLTSRTWNTPSQQSKIN